MNEPQPVSATEYRLWHGAELRELLNSEDSAELIRTYFDRSPGPHYTGA